VRAVIDTNVLVAAMLWHGPPHVLLEHVRASTLSLVSSPALLAELTDVLGRTKFDAILTRTNISRERVLAEARQLAEIIDPPPLPQPVCRDPDDDQVLALAIAAKVELIVSGDEDLLDLQSFEGIPKEYPRIRNRSLTPIFRLPQHHRAPAVEKHAVIEVEFDRAGERDALHVATDGGEILR
jgi:uncharacterized protein